jgi:hypothetical protein
MASFSNTAKNEKTLTNQNDAGDIIVDKATILVNDALRPVDSLGTPITKIEKNEKTLTNLAEHI